jgi:hypothetical protein
MAAPQDLTLLQSVKAWVFGTPVIPPGGGGSAWPTDGDMQAGALITSVSRGILTFLERGNLLYHTAHEIKSGLGGNRIMLHEYPVLSVSAVSVDGLSISPRGQVGSSGYVLQTTGGAWDGSTPGDPSTLIYAGGCFNRGDANIDIQYKAGYAVLGEVGVAAATLAPSAPWGRFTQDIGVAYADGTPLTKVASAPAQGQYTAPAAPPRSAQAPTYAPSYGFNAADVGASVLLSYSFVPFEIDFCCCKIVGEQIKYSSRIGAKSTSLAQGGGTAAWDISMMPADVSVVLNNYRQKMFYGA